MSDAGGESMRPVAEVWVSAANELGEGAIAHPARRSLLWFDILRGRLFERPFAGGWLREHALGLMASAAALVDDRRVLLATETDLRLFDLESGIADPLCPLLADMPRLRSNDARVHPSGAFWVGTMGRNAETDAGAIWWFRKGELRLLFEHITIPNSICFARGGRLAYFSDSARSTIWQVAVDPDEGRPVGEPHQFRSFSADEGRPDGAVVDEEGRLWVSAFGGSAVHAISAGGSIYETYRLPVSQPTCPAFFGERFDRLAITTARENLGPDALMREPLAGSVFELRAQVRGAPEPFVRITH
jgi:sugar lactone lactonase YvrE